MIASELEAKVEPLSILNPPIIDLLNDPRLTSDGLMKMIDDQERAITQQTEEWSRQIKPGDIRPLEAMTFACVQHEMHVTCLNTKLTAKHMDHGYALKQLNLRLERLTKWLIGLTVVLAVLTLPLAIEAVAKWLK